MTASQLVESPAAFDVASFVRPVVRTVPTYVPAKAPAEQPSRIVKLDMNESSYGPSPKARAALAEFTATHRYPEFDAGPVREALARYTGAPMDQIICGAGLDDVLNTIFHTVIDPGDEVIVSEPTFGVYRSLVALHGGRIVDAPLTPDFILDADRVLSSVTERTKLIIVCTPNNPTGNVLDPATVERIVAEAPCLVAIDEAYAEFAGTTHLPLMDRYPNVIILRTMSKFAGLAGMRVGYGIFPTELMPYLQTAVPPFHNVTLASTAAVVASLDDLPYLQGVVARITADRDALADNLREFPGVAPLPSATNFLLVRLPVEDAAPVVKELARRGILVRHFGKPELGIRDCLRVTIGTTEENELFLAALANILAEGGAAS
ncbi:MAG: histidinol-phosphate aminotransferase [Thermomicrobiales bacterium]|nr:histidinol-phosphate aminotransferase [Thermomicrobiales bacterium]